MNIELLRPHFYLVGMYDTSSIKGYHAHVYFDADSKEKAQALCLEAAEKFGVAMGHLHDRPIGPHPRPSCQLGATPEQFQELLPWLALNRDGLIVFAHPETDEPLLDHRDRAIWLGTGLELKLGIFNRH